MRGSRILFRNLIFIFSQESREQNHPFVEKFKKLADEVNSRDDVKLAHVKCDENPKLCESKKVTGKWTPFNC